MTRSSLRNRPEHNQIIGGLGAERLANEPEKGTAARSEDQESVVSQKPSEIS